MDVVCVSNMALFTVRELHLLSQVCKHFHDITKPTLHRCKRMGVFLLHLRHIPVRQPQYSPYARIPSCLEPEQSVVEPWRALLTAMQVDALSPTELAVYLTYYYFKAPLTCARKGLGMADWIASLCSNGMIRFLPTGSGHVTITDDTNLMRVFVKSSYIDDSQDEVVFDHAPPIDFSHAVMFALLKNMRAGRTLRDPHVDLSYVLHMLVNKHFI